MDKRIIESLKDILDFYSAETDRGKIEKNLEMLLNEAYLLGWKDSKGDGPLERDNHLIKKMKSNGCVIAAFHV